MTLDELIGELQVIRDTAGEDMPVRMVFKRRDMGDQHLVMSAWATQGLHGLITLVFAGEVQATMDWPEKQYGKV